MAAQRSTAQFKENILHQGPYSATLGDLPIAVTNALSGFHDRLPVGPLPRATAPVLGVPETRSWRVGKFRNYLIFYEVWPDRLRLLRVVKTHAPPQKFNASLACRPEIGSAVFQQNHYSPVTVAGDNLSPPLSLPTPPTP